MWRSSVALLAVSARVAAECPEAPDNFVANPGFCVGDPCSNDHCDCTHANLMINRTCMPDIPTCFAQARDACLGDSRCHSFALLQQNTEGTECEKRGDTIHWQTFALGQGDEVPNSDWAVYTSVADPVPTPVPTPPPAPTPPSPSPAPTPCGERTTIPCGADPVEDCAIRDLALEFGASLLPNRNEVPRLLYDALEMGALCGEAPPAEPDVVARHTAVSASALYVDSVKGSDSADGSEEKPFKTVLVAVQASRKTGVKSIYLREGTHRLGETIVLDTRDSGLTLAAFPGEAPIVSGGQVLSGLSWAPAPAADVPGAPDGAVQVAHVKLPVGGATPDQLFVGERREVRAKFPNGHPETHGLHTKDTLGTGMIASAEYGGAGGSISPLSKQTVVTLKAKGSSRDSPRYNKFTMKFGGGCERYANNASFWGGTDRPSSLVYNVEDTGKTFAWKKPETGVFHTFHGSHWGGWMFKITAQRGTMIKLDPWGGQQEARGKSGGAEWYVENILEELDSPSEWFFEADSSQLYYYPNSTDPPQEVVYPDLTTLLRINGSKAAPVHNISLQGLVFMHTRTTFLEPYEVPSGGDWSIHRGGAIFVEGSEGFSVDGCSFTRLGGNGVFLSNYNRGTRIAHSEFSWLGDNAISAVGSTRFQQTANASAHSLDLMDATDGNHPEGTVVESNLIHETGVFGKQTSGFIQSLAAKTTLRGNVIFNSPRAGINFNDGFGGGNLVEKNLLFNHVRETGDHGPFNSWDRLPYYTNTTGTASTGVLEQVIRNNFIISNYASVWPIDHDDGSCYYNDYNNFLIYGGAKNYQGYNKRSASNVYIRVDLNGKKTCALDDSKGANDIFSDNICTTASGDLYYWQHVTNCKPHNLNATVDVSYNNQFFCDSGKTEIKCGKETWMLSEYQDRGYDIGSTESTMPPVDQVIAWGRQMIDLPAKAQVFVV